MYVWGGNVYGELGLDKEAFKNSFSPVMVYINDLLL